MLEAANRAGVVNVVNFNYRKAPAIALAKRLVEDGRIGEIRHWRAVYLQDFILDPSFPLIWRLQKDKAGSGALGDIGAHIVDLAQYLVGPVVEVVEMMETFIEERPLEEASEGLSATGGTETGRVTVDDAASFLVRFENGATGTFEATRLAAGRKNHNAFEINGTEGSILFDLERMNELQVYFADDPAEIGGFRTVLVTEPDHPYAGAWWPPGHIIGYEHTFIHAVKDLMDGIAAGKSPAPTFEDGYRCQAVLDAVERSVESKEWTRPVNTP
jgi:predicted dehydrogenase